MQLKSLRGEYMDCQKKLNILQDELVDIEEERITLLLEIAELTTVVPFPIV